MTQDNFEYDQVIIGSGFGGSVSALRLSEKGYKVLILEKGKWRKDNDYPESNWDTKNYIWEPGLGMHGTTQFSFTSKSTIIHGVGVGGGSQVYANVHLIPEDKVFDSPAWSRVYADWKDRLAPFYGLAQRMLGSTTNPYFNAADYNLKSVAEDIGRGDSFKTVNTGVVFSEGEDDLGKPVGDPYFNGDGPVRSTCQRCGSCVIGCRHNAKNTLLKNYLYFAQRNGVEIRAESEVTRIDPLPNDQGVCDGSAGFELSVQTSTKRFGKERHKIRCRGVVVSAGVMGTVPLLLKMRDQTKTLPAISPWLGQQVRTNSETLITANNLNEEVWEGTTITSMISADDDTTIEINRFSHKSDGTWFYMPYVPMVEGKGLGRVGKFFWQTLRHPIKTVKMLNPKGKARNSILFLVMQTTESYIHLEWRRKWYRLFRKAISAVQKPDDVPLTVSFPAAEDVAKRYSDKMDGEPGTALSEIFLGTPFTAHIMGGVSIGTDKTNGVVDTSGAVFGYKNLRVLDGSIIPGNLGVNPSLTITALSEYAMAQVPAHNVEKEQNIKPVLFSKPLPAQVSSLKGEGNLLEQVVEQMKQ